VNCRINGRALALANRGGDRRRINATAAVRGGKEKKRKEKGNAIGENNRRDAEGDTRSRRSGIARREMIL